MALPSHRAPSLSFKAALFGLAFAFDSRVLVRLDRARAHLLHALLMHFGQARIAIRRYTAFA